jgi:hypothetical protein
MADLRISQLPVLTGALLQATDPIAVADLSASETKKITAKEFVEGAVALIDDLSIPGSKVDLTLAANSVNTAQLVNGAVTELKLANSSSGRISSTATSTAGAYIGQLAVLTPNNVPYIWNGSSWVQFQTGVLTITGGTAGAVITDVTTVSNNSTVIARIENATGPKEFLAGPASSSGAFSRRQIVPEDLPLATTSTAGIASVPAGEGIRIDGGVGGLEARLEIDNDVTESVVHHVVTYNDKGLVTGGRVISSADLPLSTAGSAGAVAAGTEFQVNAGTGVLSHTNQVVAGTGTKITYDGQGHVVSSASLASGDIPSLDASKITTGTFDIGRIADGSISGVKLANYSVTKIGETLPTAENIGQFFFNPITRDLFLWDGNVYQPVGISAGEIVLAGTYDASTNLLSSVTPEGTAAGFVNGNALPAASTGNNRYYVVVNQSGTGTAPAPVVLLEPPDILLSNGSSYVLIETSETITAQIASNVGFTPTGSVASTNVQAAIAEVDTEKLAKAGGTITGELLIGTAGSLVFEGSTDNAFETTLAVTDPTADRTITFKDATGTVALTSDLDDGTY